MNTITIELCAEDRARLDRLTAALEEAAVRKVFFGVDLAEEASASGTAPEMPREAPEAEPEEITAPAEEIAPSAATAQVAPAVTLEQIQQKVVQLCAGYGGTKKAAVREIVNAYAQKVSDLPEDKWTEVWEKLTALESEG